MVFEKWYHLLSKFEIRKEGELRLELLSHLIPKLMFFPLCCVELKANATSCKFAGFWKLNISGSQSGIFKPGALSVSQEPVRNASYHPLPHTHYTEPLALGPANYFNKPSWWFWCTSNKSLKITALAVFAIWNLKNTDQRFVVVFSYNVGLFLLRAMLGRNPFCN